MSRYQITFDIRCQKKSNSRLRFCLPRADKPSAFRVKEGKSVGQSRATPGNSQIQTWREPFFKKSEVEESQRKTKGERRGSYEIEVLVLSFFVCSLPLNFLSCLFSYSFIGQRCISKFILGRRTIRWPRTTSLQGSSHRTSQVSLTLVLMT